MCVLVCVCGSVLCECIVFNDSLASCDECRAETKPNNIKRVDMFVCMQLIFTSSSVSDVIFVSFRVIVLIFLLMLLLNSSRCIVFGRLGDTTCNERNNHLIAYI